MLGQKIWRSYTPRERRNIILYIIGLMLYKFSFEIWTGSLTTIALNRFHEPTTTSGSEEIATNIDDEPSPVGILGVLQSLNLLSQCLGTALVTAELQAGWSTRRILILAVLCGAGIAGGVLGMDAGTGGRWREVIVVGGEREGERDTKLGEERYGRWDARILFLVFVVAGVVSGMVEVVRKVVPRDVLRESFMKQQEEVVGEDGENNIRIEDSGRVDSDGVGDKNGLEVDVGDKLRRVDAAVHIFYELAGTGGAFLGAELSLKWGSNYAIGIVPLAWVFACGAWMGVRLDDWVTEGQEEEVNIEFVEMNTMLKDKGQNVGSPPVAVGQQVGRGKNVGFWRSAWCGIKNSLTILRRGARLIFSTPQYAWLPLGYSLSLYSHRYLENGLAPAVAKYVYNESAFYQIIVGGSNLGELLGALTVFLLAEKIKSPLPWMRLDAVALLGVWAVVAWRPPLDTATGKVPVQWAWKLAAIFLPISLGWAAGDVSLIAYIQANLGKHEKAIASSDGQQSVEKSKKERNQDGITSLGAIMAVLYSTYVALYALLNPLLGMYIDNVVNKNNNIGSGFAREEGWDARGGIWKGLMYVAGVQFTIISVLIGTGTWIATLKEWPWNRERSESRAVLGG